MKSKGLLIFMLPALVLAWCSTETKGGQDVLFDPTDDTVDMPVTCDSGSDLDFDGIASAHEGAEDFDGDTIPNYRDEDSDGDGISDLIEAGDDDCATRPVDSDGDEYPDFLDLDSDDNGVPDADEGILDTDGNGIPDYADPDNDGDRLPDTKEIGDDPAHPLDSDGDTIPNYMDTDSDNDNISDALEREIDVDGDGIPAYLDDDSDGDGYLDAEELNACLPESEVPVDTDGDGSPDFLDTDSDNDGLSDAQENVVGSSPCKADTDGDGFDDLAEWAHPTADPSDPALGIPEDDFYLVLPPGGPLEERDLDFGTDIQVADIFFLVDTTGSMYSEIDQIKATLSSIIIPNIKARIPDSHFGVAWFADFATGSYGSSSDKAFELLQEMTDNVGLAQTAVNSLPDQMGADWAESQVEALYQSCTGAGLGTWVNSYVCPDGFGAPCFRFGALPIILLFTDAPMHNGPPGTVGDAYTGIIPAPHEWSDAIAALNDLHAKVIGMDSEGSYGRDAWHDLNETAIATGTVDLDGTPLVFDIGSSGELLDTSVVDSIETIATKVPFDVDTYVMDLPDGYDDPGWEEVDARCFIKKRIPQPGWTPPPGYTAEEAVAFYDQTAFYLVLPGTQVTFKVQFQNYIDEATNCYEGDKMARVFLARIVVRGDGVTDLDEREVVIIVPSKEVILE
ncbi:MAG: hypothetical protein ABIJ56_00640 [Pseudomonadota bacterium]